ncbi:hypothetical protein CC79DRAFT_1323980 [Sarocladium strictum]
MEEGSRDREATQTVRRMDSLIDMWFKPYIPPPHTTPTPTRPLPTPPVTPTNQQDHAKYAVNKLLLRSHIALLYSPHSDSAATQALSYADRARDLAVQHDLYKHRGKAQWFRGEALMRMRRWGEAYEAFVGSARVVEGGWREVGELRERMRVCRREVEVERDEFLVKRGEKYEQGKVKKRVRKGVRFDV